jgi:sugar lactone lactonase YvrE
MTHKGFTSGVPVVARDNSIYLTIHGDTSYIWHIDIGGKSLKFARLPKGSWPNGLDIGPDGMLYSPDSSLGVIWRVDPTSGRVGVALRDPALLARPFISLAPGANGLHFKGHNLLVTVSDRTTVQQYLMDAQGHFGPATVIASGIPGDDFDIGKDGSLFITTHPYNTVVRVSPGGERTIVGKMEQHIVGATDAAFGKTGQDRNTLYVVTDGGAFNGGSKTRGELVMLQPYAR